MVAGILPNAKNQFVDINGKPLVGGAVYMYVPNSLVPKDTYQDPALSILNTNPIILDEFGQCLIWGDGVYRQRVFDSLGNLQWDYETETAQVSTISTFAVAQCTIDGDGSTPGTGICADDYIPVACTLQYAVLQSTLTGSIAVDIWMAPFVVNAPPTVANSIVASTPPTLSTAQSAIDNILSGWTKTVAANTAVRYNINSISTLTRFTLTLFASIP